MTTNICEEETNLSGGLVCKWTTIEPPMKSKLKKNGKPKTDIVNSKLFLRAKARSSPSKVNTSPTTKHFETLKQELRTITGIQTKACW